MDLKLYQVSLGVENIDKAESFYRQLLGTAGQRKGAGGVHFKCGELVLICHLSKQSADLARAAATATHLLFVVADLEALFGQAKTAGCASMDDQVTHLPWGDRSFSVTDPFGNPLSFIDVETMKQRSGEKFATGPDDRLKAGATVRIRGVEAGPESAITAHAVKIFGEELWLELPQASSPSSFEKGNGVSIQFSDEAAAYLADTEVVRTSLVNSRYVAILAPREATKLERRTGPRVPMETPFTFSILAGGPDDVDANQVFEAKTINVGSGGVKFDTSVPLEDGAELELELWLSPGNAVKVPTKIVSTSETDREGRVLKSFGAKFLGILLEDQVRLLEFLIQNADEIASVEPKSDTGVEIQTASKETHPVTSLTEETPEISFQEYA